MDEDTMQKNRFKKFFSLDASYLRHESFLGLGFESVFGGLIFGFLVGIYPLFTSIPPFLPASNIVLFIAYGIPLTGSTCSQAR